MCLVRKLTSKLSIHDPLGSRETPLVQSHIPFVMNQADEKERLEPLTSILAGEQQNNMFLKWILIGWVL